MSPPHCPRPHSGTPTPGTGTPLTEGRRTCRVHVSVGSSLGDRGAHLNLALAAISDLPGLRVRRVSPLYETAPVGGVAAHRFWNGVLELDVASTVSPEGLLDHLLAIESLAGRTRSVRWEDRTLDLDIVLWQRRVVQTPRLRIPHPEMHRRRFVLVPLVDLVPQQRHPVLGVSLADLLARLTAQPDDVVRVPRKRIPAGWPG